MSKIIVQDAPVESGEIQRIEQSIKVELTPKNLTQLAVNRFKKHVNQEIAKGTKLLNKQAAVTDEAIEELRKRCKVVAKKKAAALHAMFQPAFRALELDCDHCFAVQGVTDGDEDVDHFIVKFQVFSAKTKSSYGGGYAYRDEIKSCVPIQWDTCNLTEAREQFLEAAKHQASIEKHVTIWREKLRSARDIADDAEARLTEATLNQTDQGKEILANMGYDVAAEYLGDIETFENAGLLAAPAPKAKAKPKARVAKKKVTRKRTKSK